MDINKFMKMAENIVRNHHESKDHGGRNGCYAFREYQDSIIYIVHFWDYYYAIYSKRVSGHLLIVAQSDFEGESFFNVKEAGIIQEYVEFLSNCADQGLLHFESQAEAMAWEDEERRVTPRKVVSKLTKGTDKYYD